MFSGLKLEKSLFKEVLITNFTVINADVVVNIDGKQLITSKSSSVGIYISYFLNARESYIPLFPFISVDKFKIPRPANVT